MKNKSLSLFISIAGILVLGLHIVSYQFNLMGEQVLMPLRIITILLFMYYAIMQKKLPTWILVSMLIGIEVGYDFPHIAIHLDVLSKVFLKLIKTIIAPLIFATLVVGIAGHSNLKQVGRIAWKSIVYFYFATTLALFIGLAAINFTKAGAGITMPTDTKELPKVEQQTWQDMLLHIFPENIAKSIAEGQVLQVVIFSIIFGIALAMLSDRLKRPLLDFSESLAEVMFKFTNIVMYFAPIGVGGAIAYTVGKMGIGVLLNGIYLVLTLYGALIAFILLVLLPICFFTKLNIKNLFKAISEPFTLAFATASSESALPKAMRNMEQYGVPRKIVSFVMPLGYSFNLDGTTLYLSLASIFVAQACQVDLSIGQQLFIVFTLMITSKGVAGVPRASFVILLGTIASFGLKEWPLYIILGIDALMDMARTSVNVMGNCIASAVVARWEGELDDTKMNSEDVLSNTIEGA
ncbi:MAG: cation:dicarboxylase symporter family transporter [Bacteroidetes bacterium]|jgi:proton glutamate symport protein|nr:cation:dicarboxylase symporter family transporter [Bacteroidota bacterium]MBK7041998.1 cation:dicarboxylase symporter family transporter [Bacteroidota bacterium]MBK9301304.1 cation:dicarboxylase symporter family transporter [Bacteroidota bacterium]HQW46419.1 cation:dicarboxylase symporter family transporter [Chitinophagaceae bacterium]